METLNLKEKAFLREVFEHPLFESILNAENRSVFESLEEKVYRKKVDSKAILPTLTLRSFTFQAAEGNGSILILADKTLAKLNGLGGFQERLSKEDNLILFEYFFNLLNFYEDTLPQLYHKGYGDHFNVYEKEVERSFDWSSSNISFVCYTDNENDDHWTRISRLRVKEITRMLTTYLFLYVFEGDEELLQRLPENIQTLYPMWFEYKTEKDAYEQQEREQRQAELQQRRQAAQSPTKPSRKKK